MGHARHAVEAREVGGVAAVGGSQPLVPGRRVVDREDGVADAVIDHDLGAAVVERGEVRGLHGQPEGAAGGTPQIMAVPPESIISGTKNSQYEESALLWPLSNGKLA